MENVFIVIVPVYNAEQYIEKCLMSIISQDYNNYKLIVVDDNSTDNTFNIITDIKNKYNDIIVVRNLERNGSGLSNIIKGMTYSSYEEDIIISVDGDDWLSNNTVLSYLNDVYQDKEIFLTYGQYKPLVGNYRGCRIIPDIKTYRKSGIWVTSQLRTFKRKIFNKINDIDLRDTNGDYYKVAWDTALMYPMIEMCGYKHIKFINNVLYIYNNSNPINDFKINHEEQRKMHLEIMRKPQYLEIK